MFNQYFGQYLYNQGLLTAEQMNKALIHERSVNLKLGVLAINAGLMTAVQVEEIHQLQHKRDKRFGELAIELSYLTVEQLDELLDSQRRRHLSLSQALVDLGYLKLEQLETILLQYKKDSQLTEEQWKALEACDADAISKLFLDFSDMDSLAEIYRDYMAVAMRSMVRFLSEQPALGKNRAVGELSSDYLVAQEFMGETSFYSAFALDGATLLELARRYSGEQLDSIDELALDSAAEFLNVLNGIFCVNASDRGKDLDLQPQYIVEKQRVGLEQGQCIPIELSFGKISIVLASKANKL